MTKHSTRIPAFIDWQQMKQSKLTLELSRREVADMSDELAVRRILTALHEAAHFLIAAHDGLELHDVRILNHQGKSLSAGAHGGVRFNLHNNQLLPMRFHFAGTVHDVLMYDRETIASTNDWVDGLEYLVGHCTEHGIPPAESHAIAGEEAREVAQILKGNWKLVYSLACAFLTYSDAQGSINPALTQQLYKHVVTDHSAWLDVPYGSGVLDAGTIERFNPPQKVASFTAKVISRAERQPWLISYLAKAA